MAVVHEHLPPLAGDCRVGIGFPAQQRVRIVSGSMAVVAELDVAEIPFRTLSAWLWSTKTLTRA